MKLLQPFQLFLYDKSKKKGGRLPSNTTGYFGRIDCFSPGFTLIEIICTIVLISFAALVSGMLLVRMTDAYILSKANMTLFQKAQVTMRRISQEFENIMTVNAGSNSSITFTAKHGAGVGGEEVHTIAITGGNTITIDGSVLTDQVSQFVLTYYDSFDAVGPGIRNSWSAGNSKMINVSIVLIGDGGANVTFASRTGPRNL